MEPTHTVLSLDLGLDVGWCIGRNNQILVSGIKSFRSKKGTHPGKKFADFHNWLLNFSKVDEVFFEIVPKFESMHAALVYAGMRAQLDSFLYHTRIGATGVYPTTVKKIFTGHGKADKVKMCEHAHHLGWMGGKKGTADFNDEADACAVYYTVMNKRGIEVTFAPHTE